MEIDIHGQELSEAVIEVLYGLKECDTHSDSRIDIIHGYHAGTVLKNYLRSPKFIKDAAKDGFVLTSLKNANPGITSYLVHRKKN